MKTYESFSLRLPPDLKKWLRKRAARDERSMQRTVIHLLKQAQEQDKPSH